MSTNQKNGIVLRPQVLPLLRSLRMTQVQLADKMDVSRQYVSELLISANPGIGKLIEVAEALGTTVAEIWPDPLLCQSVRHLSPVSPMTSVSAAEGSIPLYEEVEGERVQAFLDGKLSPSSYITLPGVSGSSAAFRATDNYMAEYILRRDLVIGRKLTDKSLVEWGQVYVVLTRDKMRIRRVRRHSNPDLLRLVAQNEQSDDIDLPIGDVLALYEVKAVVNY